MAKKQKKYILYTFFRGQEDYPHLWRSYGEFEDAKSAKNKLTDTVKKFLNGEDFVKYEEDKGYVDMVSKDIILSKEEIDNKIESFFYNIRYWRIKEEEI